MIASVLAGAIPVVPMQFTRGSSCGLYVGPTPFELTLKLDGGQIWLVAPERDPDQSQPIRVQLGYPGEGFSPPSAATFQRLRIPRTGTYRYRILSSGSADQADVRFCAF